MNITLSNGKVLPIEMHQIKIVQKTHLPPASRRLEAMQEAGFNTFLLRTKDIFLDMLTDSGTNAMSDRQLSAMMASDDAYAGSESFFRLAAAVQEVFGLRFVMPVHQGRAAEHLLAKAFVKPGDAVLMNYHFTTSKAHVDLAGGRVIELFGEDALETCSCNPFKGNLDLGKFAAAVEERGPERIAYVRMEATTNLIGGQPFSMQNLRDVKAMADSFGIPLVFDGSLISENAYFIQQREAEFAGTTLQEIILEMMRNVDILYMSGRKSAAARGGLIATNRKDFYDRILAWLPVYEGFATYGGMSTKEIEAMAVGLREMTDPAVASSSADFIEYFVRRLAEEGVPVVTPAGGLACHLDATRFLPHIPQSQYPAGALAAAIYIASGIRGMERGTISTDRGADGSETLADMELVRLALPRRLYTLSHIEYAIDRLKWLFVHRELIGGLKFVEEPAVLRFFFGRLAPIGGWDERLAEDFRADFGDAC
ncbi:tryptophanase [Longilinea arvoryzae]|uniref:Tryptophanase n=1 Tax=Longilinea arvoryzae TaxID=360412 RepID=A0A0S7BE45_9CHLR|nr:tryptophanase [Longilinea arvoryzae]GAP12662.1 tryptophanase [Longilinea arvoryzae]